MTPEQVAELRQKYYNATVAWFRRANPDLMCIRIKPDFPIPAHSPGQYSSLGLGNWEERTEGCQPEMLKPGDETKLVRRAYSISCPVLDDAGQQLMAENPGWLEFYIVLVRDSGRPQAPGLTPRLFNLKVGDRLNMVEKIAGNFTSAPIKPGDNVIFLSTGTGEAPHNYLLWELLRKGHTGKMLSACCVRYKQDLAYLDTHKVLMSRYPQYKYLSLTTREMETVNQKVYIQDLLTSGQLEEHLGDTLDPARTHVYLCGNPKMIGVQDKDKATGEWVYPKPLGVIEILEKLGFKTDAPAAKLRGNIHFEEYW